MALIFPYITAFLAMVCYAILPVMSKKVQGDIPSFFYIAITMAVLCALSAIVALAYEKEFSVSGLSVNAWIWIVGFSFLNFVAFALLLSAIKGIPIAEYQLIALMTPIVGGLVSYVFLQEAFKMQYITGWFLSLSGYSLL